MSQEDDGAGEMDHADEVLQGVFPAYCETAEVLEPSKQTFYFPAAAVATQRASILRVVFAVASVWGNHLDSGLGQFLIEPIGIVGVGPDEALYGFGDEDLGQGLLDQRHLVRRSRFCTHGDWKASAVCHCHDLGPLAALRLTQAGAPLFAGAKLPSMKASWRWNPPRACRSSARASSTPRITPECTHCWNRR